MTSHNDTLVTVTCQAILTVTRILQSTPMTVVQPRFASDEKKPAPMPLLVVQGFVNTLDLEEGTDVLADADGAREWLIDAGLLDPGGVGESLRAEPRARGSREPPLAATRTTTRPGGPARSGWHRCAG